MRAPRRAGRGDVQVAKLDRAQAGAAAQLPARDLLRGHGESLRARVRGMPGSPSLPRAPAAAGPGTSPESGLGSAPPPPPAARSPCRSGRAGADARTDRRSAGLPTPGPARSLVGMCLLSRLQLLPNPTGESRESEPAPGSWGKGPKGARARGRWEPAGRARGGHSRPRGAAAREARGAGSAARVGCHRAPGTLRRGRGRRALGRSRN